MSAEPVKLVPRLLDVAQHTSASIAAILADLESYRSDGKSGQRKQRKPSSVLDTCKVLVQEHSVPLVSTMQAASAERIARIIATSWEQNLHRQTARPDILALTCRVLATPEEPQSYTILKFVVILALRSLYGILHTNESLDSLRTAYEALRERIVHTQARRQLKKAGNYETFLVDLLVLEGAVRRGLGGDNVNAYYKSFLEHPFGINTRGERVFSRREKLPQLYPQGSWPDFPSILNLAFSQPLAVPGLDEITGGLVPSVAGPHSKEAGGLVTLVAGKPGTGKTSFCLALAGRMAEFGAAVVYRSTEESAGALKAKQTSMMGRGLVSWWPGLFTTRTEEYFDIAKVDPASSLEDVRQTLLADLSGTSSTSVDPSTTIYLPFPNVLVLDSLTALLDVSGHSGASQTAENEGVESPIRRRQLSTILSDMRELGVCVFLVVGLGEARDSGLQYLVDNVFVLDTDEAEDAKRHPLRTFNVEKTRLQSSFRGRHVLHLSRESGFIISPSLESVLAEVKNVTTGAGDPACRAVVWTDASHQFDPITIRRGAHTLIFGRGSAGKAKFALAIALEPRVNVDPRSRWNEYLNGHSDAVALSSRSTDAQADTRVLIVSFLYSAAYYDEIANDIARRRFGPAIERRTVPICDTVDLYPGLIDPETLIAKVRKKFMSAKLEGKPFTAVVVDGVHNLLLQYPLLANEPLLWPCLYRFFRSETVDTISTFTFFKVARIGEMVAERKSTSVVTVTGTEHLFFHLLVSSSDYSFVVEGRDDVIAGPERNLVTIELASTIDGFRNEPGRFSWDPRTSRYGPAIGLQKAAGRGDDVGLITETN